MSLRVAPACKYFHIFMKFQVELGFRIFLASSHGMQTLTARSRRNCSHKKSPGSTDGWQNDLFQACMVTPMQIDLTRLKARYWHWISSVSGPAGQSRCQICNETHLKAYKSITAHVFFVILIHE